MTRTRLYLDHNASSPLRPEARAAMLDALERHGNASSVHGEGRAARSLVEDAREQVAALVACQPAEVVFTSGATEANCTVLGGPWRTIFATGTEHESVLVPARHTDATLVELPVDRDGVADLGPLPPAGADTSSADAGAASHALLSLQMANNETGVCQDMAAAAERARASAIAVHTDAVQACGRMAVDFAGLGVDFMSVSSHKLGGPMGVGALIIRDGVQLPSLIGGGGQERRRRAGTENVAAIAGFGAAAAAAKDALASETQRLAAMRDRAEAEIRAAAPPTVMIGAGATRLANTTCVAVPGEAAETMVIKLDLAGVAISAGSACSSGKVGASHVLTAMGVPGEIARSAIRISLGWNTTETCLEQFLSRFRRLLEPPNRAVA